LSGSPYRTAICAPFGSTGRIRLALAEDVALRELVGIGIGRVIGAAGELGVEAVVGRAENFRVSTQPFDQVLAPVQASTNRP
jgi:hypothetical protein